MPYLYAKSIFSINIRFNQKIIVVSCIIPIKHRKICRLWRIKEIFYKFLSLNGVLTGRDIAIKNRQIPFSIIMTIKLNRQ